MPKANNQNKPPENRPRELKRLVFLSLLMLLANFADYYSTIYALKRGFQEANPFLDMAINANSFTQVKLIIPVLIVIYSLIRVIKSDSPKSIKRVGNLMIFGSIYFSVIALHNSIVILLN